MSKKKRTEIFFEPNDSRKPNWKKGDKVLCINNYGFNGRLTIGKEYEVIKSYKDYGADQIQVIGDCGIADAFSSRFTTVKLERKQKLNKINNV